MPGTGLEPVGYVGNRQFTRATTKYSIHATATPKILPAQNKVGSRIFTSGVGAENWAAKTQETWISSGVI